MSKYNLYRGSTLHTLLESVAYPISQDTTTQDALKKYFKYTLWLLNGDFADGGHMHDKCGLDAAELQHRLANQKTRTGSDLAVKNLLIRVLALGEQDYKNYSEAHAAIFEITDALHNVVRHESKRFTLNTLMNMHIKISRAVFKMGQQLPKDWKPTPAPETEKPTREDSMAETSRKKHMALGVALLEKCSKDIFIYAGTKPYLSDRGGKLRDRVEGIVRLADEGRNYDHLLHEFTYQRKNKWHWDRLSEPVQLLNTIIVNSHEACKDTDTIVLCAHKIIKMVKIDTEGQTKAHEKITMLVHKHLGRGEFLLADLNNLLREHKEVIKKGGLFDEQCRRHLVITRDYVSSKEME